jgi:rhodanese-related sulfurtransferase
MQAKVKAQPMDQEKSTDVSCPRLGLLLRQVLVGTVLIMMLGTSACYVAAQSPHISPDALFAQLKTQESPMILDVRSEVEYNRAHIPGAVHVSHRDLPDRLEELAEFKSQPVILYCEAGVRAGIAETILVDSGFQQVIHLAGDMQEWRRRKFPVESRSVFP